MNSVGRGKVRRAFLIFLGAALLPALPLAAQTAPANDSTSNAIGPAQLRDFSLGARPTVQVPDQAVQPNLISPRANRPIPRTTPAPIATAPVAQPAAPAAVAAPQAPFQAPPPQRSQQSATSSVTVALPPADPLSRKPTPAIESEVPRLSSQPMGPNAPLQSAGDSDDPSLLPWIAALLLIAGAAIFYAVRSRRSGSQPVTAFPALALPPEVAPRHFPPAPPVPPRPAAPVGGITVKRPDAFAALQPAPAPARPTGIVSTRLRPQLEIEFAPTRAVIDEGQASVQFDVVVVNSGNGPARQVLVEACMINAGPEQDLELRRFFDAPVGQGDRIDSIPPLGRISLKSAVSLPLDQVRAYEVGGRKLFVPLVAFNALYQWGSGEGQSSSAFILGRSSNVGDGEGDPDARMAPLRLDLGPRIFRGLEGRRHPLGLKR